ncbi:MAG: hypothetical protein MUP70_08600, partial [Candidatus Aminicenantes bacterium]|nr:hypothetical protein [Candidatus Aminicenantes bacterium]
FFLFEVGAYPSIAQNQVFEILIKGPRIGVRGQESGVRSFLFLNLNLSLSLPSFFLVAQSSVLVTILFTFSLSF